MRKLKSISRVKYHRTKGWWVRIRWRGRIFTKLFSDRKHGGSLAARALAIAWRDRTEELLDKPRSEGYLRWGRDEVIDVG